MADYNSTHSGATIDTTITNADAGNIGKISTQTTVDANTIKINGFYALAGSSANLPVVLSGSLYVNSALSTGYTTQIFQTTTLSRMFIREQNNGTWQSWKEILHTGNMQTTTSNGVGITKLMKNTSGGAIADAASVAGSTISSVKFDNTGALTVIAVASGTWKSVNGASLASNESGYFVRTA